MDVETKLTVDSTATDALLQDGRAIRDDLRLQVMSPGLGMSHGRVTRWGPRDYYERICVTYGAF
jgi:hypothetical protein